VGVHGQRAVLAHRAQVGLAALVAAYTWVHTTVVGNNGQQQQQWRIPSSVHTPCGGTGQLEGHVSTHASMRCTSHPHQPRQLPADGGGGGDGSGGGVNWGGVTRLWDALPTLEQRYADALAALREADAQIAAGKAPRAGCGVAGGLNVLGLQCDAAAGPKEHHHESCGGAVAEVMDAGRAAAAARWRNRFLRAALPETGPATSTRGVQAPSRRGGGKGQCQAATGPPASPGKHAAVETSFGCTCTIICTPLISTLLPSIAVRKVSPNEPHRTILPTLN
jgi:hypothetical protein